METRPQKGIVIEEVSKHLEAVSQAGSGGFLNLGGQPNWEEK